MEKTETLKSIDAQVCRYFQKYNYTKKDEIYCYQTDKKQVCDFYQTMHDNFYQAKEQQHLNSGRSRHRQSKIKTKIINSIKNPINVSLPRAIRQKNQIKVEKKLEVKSKLQPMFSGVQCTKNNNYVIGEEVRSMVTQDIQEMIKKKEQQHFRRCYPLKISKSKSQIAVSNIRTEELIKTYNRILAKYKNDGNGLDPNLVLIDMNNNQQRTEDIAMSSQLFDLLGLFKKIYFQTKSDFITDNLINYVLKFKKQDKFEKLFRSRQMLSTKNSHKKNFSGTPKAFSNNRQSLFNMGSGQKIRHSHVSQQQEGKNRNLQERKENMIGQIKGKLRKFQLFSKEKVKKNKLRL